MKNKLNASEPPLDDVVALKRQIADLQKSEEFFRAITQNSSDIIIIVNKKAVITYANPSIEQFLGYKPEELIGKSGFDYIIPADIPRALLDFGKSLLIKGINITNAFGIRHKDGSTRILEGVGINLFHNPIVKGFVMNVRDITSRRKAEEELETYRRHLEELVEKRTAETSRINTELLTELAERKAVEEALKESEEKHRNFVDNAPIGVGLIDMSGKVQYINKRIEELMGWSREKVIGKYGFGLEAFDDDTRKRLLERFVARVDGDKPKVLEIPVIGKDGNRLWVEVITTILQKDGAPVGAQMAFANITERKLAEKALRESEERFRTLIQKSSDVIVILNEQGQFTYNSPSAKDVLGYSDEDIIGKSPSDFVHSDDQEKINRRLSNLANGSKPGVSIEFRALKGDGSWGFFEVIGNNLMDYPGINGIVLTIRDITERKRAEEERKALMERLHRAETMESLGTLAGGVAHDLNNVLGALVGYTELLLLKMDKDNPLKNYLHSIMKSSEKATAIIQDMLTLARRGVALSEVASLNNVLNDYFQTPEFARLKAYHPKVTLKNELAPDLLNIQGSPVHLGKTAMNLISNAVEAIADHGEVTIKTHNCYLDLPIHGHDPIREGEYVVFTVSDSGEGISPSDIEKIFEPFYTKKVMGRSGTGLGLAVVWGTVKDHAGYIDVQSQIGKGSSFTIYFPATRELLKKNQQPISLDSYMGKNESVLVVDDIQEQRDVAASLLTRLGYSVQTVANGEEAVSYIKRHSADLLVLDMIMDPGIDGLETYKQILKINPQQKTIIASGFSETERVREALELGVSAYIKKPYHLETIGMAIKKTLTALKNSSAFAESLIPLIEEE